MARRCLLVGLLAFTLWLTPAPALAWGSYTHGLIAERAYDQLVPQHPWLSVQRDAFLWGALAADMDGHHGTPYGRRAHSGDTLAALWREAVASGDASARAFVLGWAVHVASDDMPDPLAGPERRERVRAALERAGAGELPGELTPLLEWAVDAALGPVANGTFQQMARSAYMHAGTPAGAPVRRMLARVLGVDEASYLAWARFQVLMSAGGLDRYLQHQSRLARVEPWTGPLRSAEVRLALGDLTPLLTRAVSRSVAGAEALLGAPAERHAEVSGR